MVNPHAKFEVAISAHYEDVKTYIKCGNWGGLGTSKVVAPFDKSRTNSYWPSIVTMSLSCTVSEI